MAQQIIIPSQKDIQRYVKLELEKRLDDINKSLELINVRLIDLERMFNNK